MRVFNRIVMSSHMINAADAAAANEDGYEAAGSYTDRLTRLNKFLVAFSVVVLASSALQYVLPQSL